MADLTITVTIPDAKVADFKRGFLKMNPPPADWAGNNLAWIRRWAKRQLQTQYRMGRLLEKQQEIEAEGDVVSDQ